MSLVKTHLQSFQTMLSYLNVSGKQVLILVSLGIVYAGFEGVGVGMLLPVLQYLEQGPAMFAESSGSRLAAVVDYLTNALDLSSGLPVLCLLAFIPFLARQLFSYVYQVYAGTVRLEAIASVRKKGFSYLLGANLPFFMDEGQGRLNSVLTTEVERGAVALPLFLQLCQSIILLTVYLALLVFLAPWLLPVTLVGLGMVTLVVRKKVARSRHYGKEISLCNEAFHTAIAERLTGIRLLKLMGQEPQETRRLNEIVKTMTSSLVKLCRMKQGLEASIPVIMMLSAFATLYIATSVLGMTLASVGVYLFVLLRLDPLIRQVAMARQGISAHIASLNNVHAVVTRARAAADLTGGPVTFAGLQNEIVLDRVSFSYGLNGSNWALRDISFRVPKGSLIAIVGRSGAGKSTLLDLIPRLRDVSGGDIRIDGISIKGFELKSLRAAIGILDQHGFLFNDTVANNISYGISEVARAAIVQAATQAHAHHFIEELPKGYDTIVGERGARLSMGQRQRLSLARVLLQNPDILLLDEPTSALDSESEEYIRTALDCLRKDKAIIVVAHRLSTIRLADQIVVLDKGRIVEHGNHDALCKYWGTYRQLFDLQIHA